MKISLVLLCVGLLQACGSKNDDDFGGSGSPAEMDPNASTGSPGSTTSDTGTTEADTGSNSDDTGTSDGGAASGSDTAGGNTSGGEGAGGDASGEEETGEGGGSGGLGAISIAGFTVTECAGSEGETTADIRYDEVAARVRVDHDAHLANCCADFSLTATASESGNVTIVYDEGDMLCDCNCLVNLRYNIVGLPSGAWNVQIPDGLGASVTVP